MNWKPQSEIQMQAIANALDNDFAALRDDKYSDAAATNLIAAQRIIEALSVISGQLEDIKQVTEEKE